MVALRVVIGWHFFSEGLAHKNNPKWDSDSEGFMHQAKGPLAGFFHDRAPGPHNMNLLLLVPLPPESKPPEPERSQAAAKADDTSAAADSSPAQTAPADQPKPQISPIDGVWLSRIEDDWQSWSDAVAKHFAFTDVQKQQLDDLQHSYEKRLDADFSGYVPDIKLYRHELWRNAQMAQSPGADNIPTIETRIANRDNSPTSEPGLSSAMNSSPADWRADVEALEKAFQDDALKLRTADQLKLGDIPEQLTDLKKIDLVIIWLLIIGGGCLIVGLFTRLSALLLALFLASIIATQPPWIDGTVATYFQGVELVALLVLATSPVGRWGGLDFFIHRIITWPFRKRADIRAVRH